MKIVKDRGDRTFSITASQELAFHKALESSVQVMRDSNGLAFDVSFSTRGDHAGLKFHVALGRFLFEAAAYDVRHWNYKEGRFYRPGEEHYRFEGYPHE